ncbi:ell-associated factor Eaf [Anoplophora glabripennis]|uniref:ell-associated factor Eaf n=1 Tax=Anoplophora glabripennis TaxID=217634 RepID=UPI0008743C9E|nr:ell-associated factor Eaf [Anoplophora glabripennis]
MAEKLGLGNEVRELKIGQSFTNPKSTAFHTVKYDFKPASVDTNKKATVDVGSNHQVTVTVPHLDGAGVPQTVFKGSQRPYQKECVLIIDRITGEITLEKLGCNIQVKKTRSEYNKLHLPQDRLSQGNDRSGTTSSSLPSRSHTPPMLGHRVSSKTKVASGSRRPDRQITHLVPKHSPLHASPSYPSPGHHIRSPKRDLHNNINNESHNQSTLASLPMIGIDDFSDPVPPPQNMLAPLSSHNSHSSLNTTEKSPIVMASDTENGVGEMSDSTSSSSDSDSDSDVEETANANKNINIGKSNGYSNNNSTTTKIATHLLNEDLCLSESGSDSD